MRKSMGKMVGMAIIVGAMLLGLAPGAQADFVIQSVDRSVSYKFQDPAGEGGAIHQDSRSDATAYSDWNSGLLSYTAAFTPPPGGRQEAHVVQTSSVWGDEISVTPVNRPRTPSDPPPPFGFPDPVLDVTAYWVDGTTGYAQATSFFDVYFDIEENPEYVYYHENNSNDAVLLERWNDTLSLWEEYGVINNYASWWQPGQYHVTSTVFREARSNKALADGRMEFSLAIVPVPEPASLSILGLGLLGVGLRRKFLGC